MSFAPRGPFKRLYSANTSFNTSRELKISLRKALFSRGLTYAKRNSFSYRAVLNIKRFDVALKCFHIKIKKNDDNFNLIRIVALNPGSGKRA